MNEFDYRLSFLYAYVTCFIPARVIVAVIPSAKFEAKLVVWVGNQFTIIKKQTILLHRKCTHHKRGKKAMNETEIKQGKESMKKYVNLS